MPKKKEVQAYLNSPNTNPDTDILQLKPLQIENKDGALCKKKKTNTIFVLKFSKKYVFELFGCFYFIFRTIEFPNIFKLLSFERLFFELLSFEYLFFELKTRFFLLFRAAGSAED